ncbi:MAG TPA: TerB family tellurite resistance protein [Longimicrobiales bacterium]|nr:TerB family tellurite resistance protein [Longimicrobiales bacterium]
MPSLLFESEPTPIRRERGEFDCPQCIARRAYQRTEVRRHVRVLGARIPAGRYGEYVECQTCLGTFRPEVLAYDAGERTPVVMAEYQRAIRRILALMVAADGVVRPLEIGVAREIFEAVSGLPLSERDVRDEVEEVRRAPTTVARFLARVVGYVNDYGKEQILRACALVSRADGEVHEREAEMVRRLGGVLRAPRERVEGILGGA